MKPADADHTGVIMPPPLIYASGFLLVLLLHWYWPVPLTGRAEIALWRLGCGLVGVGMALDGWGALTLRRSETAIHPTHSATHLVTSGPYRFSRNPLYLGLSGIFMGLALILNTLWGLLVLAPVLGVMHYGVIRQEERHLAARFGAAFQDYRSRIRRYL